MDPTRNLEQDQKQYAIISDTKVEVPARGTTVAQAQSESTQLEESYVYLNLKTRAGDKYLGWTARVLDGSGAIVAVRSGLPEHDKVAKDAPLDGDGLGTFR